MFGFEFIWFVYTVCLGIYFVSLLDFDVWFGLYWWVLWVYLYCYLTVVSFNCCYFVSLGLICLFTCCFRLLHVCLLVVEYVHVWWLCFWRCACSPYYLVYCLLLITAWLLFYLLVFGFTEACRVLLFVEHLLCICLFTFEGSFGVLLVVLLLFALLIGCFNSNLKFGIVFYYVLLGIECGFAELVICLTDWVAWVSFCGRWVCVFFLLCWGVAILFDFVLWLLIAWFVVCCGACLFGFY